MLRTVTATRYITPLREGGSLPAIVEADDDGLYVLKFRGAGQGPKVLIAEMICGEIGRALGLPIPELVFIEVDPGLGRNEPDGEIQDLVEASGGLNIAMDFLPGSLAVDPLSAASVDAPLASKIVWFDAFLTNMDRTARNTNMIWWHRKLWLIDHGAALYVHHTWTDYQTRARSNFAVIRDHVLLSTASDLRHADALLAPQITPELLHNIISHVPDTWLLGDPTYPESSVLREVYFDYLQRRLAEPRTFVEEAINARAQRL